ncbi:MAG: hypothetical protein V1844_10350, partial [Pseudomonadota bacterium]
AFNQVTASSDKVVGLMGDIEAASREQAQGIDQLNQAIAEMSTTTQQNAGNAENLSNIMSIFTTEAAEQSDQRKRGGSPAKLLNAAIPRVTGGRVGRRSDRFLPL